MVLIRGRRGNSAVRHASTGDILKRELFGLQECATTPKWTQVKICSRLSGRWTRVIKGKEANPSVSKPNRVLQELPHAMETDMDNLLALF